ncbi:type IV secretory system conjugative DNA transfer family protein [Ruthenibacterium lactatiformans]|uniref:type IV secretory system conjugative DNA transfer family protein n=1 Tax=Ruthenibacterium lactatiformans TaxID=1550024 RepID=UPI001967D60A|nr:type IV secretory system conjugative DNA transfer family protein [Ruthenibacterium lactatiformans]MBN3014962.1 type IV secretory system conjugative DNA transfer family protein [Ruthenibacterium lactatiformans]
MKKFVEKDVAENPLYHDTWKLLKKYRDVVWSLEISVQHVRSKFEIEYGTSIEEFLDSIYLAGADLNGSDIEHHAKCIERSHKMLKLLDSAVELLRTRHKNGEAYYWLLYYSFLSPQQLKNVEEIIENLRPHIRDISFRTYYRRRREAIDALSSVLWGYTSKDSLDTWRISNYTPEYRETSGVGKRPVLTPDEVLRLPIKQALVIIRGQKVLKVDKMDYSKHPEASKLRSCKASAHIPEWRRLEQEQPKPSAAQPKPQAPAPKKPVKKKAKAASTSTGTKQTAAVPAAEAPNGIITTDKDSILS